MPDTYFTRKEAIAHGEAIDPITREEALIQKAATPLSVKDAALYALKDGGSEPSFDLVMVKILGASSLSDIPVEGTIAMRLETSEGQYNYPFVKDDAGTTVFNMPIPNFSDRFRITTADSSLGLYDPLLKYTGLNRIPDSYDYTITSNTVTIYVGAKLGGK